MTEQAEVSDVNRDRQFEIVRDGEFAEAKKVLSTADMTWRHSALRQNFLFFIAARRRRGSELLAKQCVAMGVDLEEEDVHGQTPLFWAAARGNLAVVKFLLNLGFEINYRDNARKTALFLSIENGHLEVADYLIERGASIFVRSNKVTPHAMLKKLGRKPPERKRKLTSPTPSCICPGAAARSRFAQWEWKYDENEPQIDRKEDNVLVETPQYLSKQVSMDINFQGEGHIHSVDFCCHTVCRYFFRFVIMLLLLRRHSLVVIKHCTASAPARAASLLR